MRLGVRDSLGGGALTVVGRCLADGVCGANRPVRLGLAPPVLLGLGHGVLSGEKAMGVPGLEQNRGNVKYREKRMEK